MMFTRPVLTIRLHAGFNAEVFLAGLLGLMNTALFSPEEFFKEKFPNIHGTLRFKERFVNSISGVTAEIERPIKKGHAHRDLASIYKIYKESHLTPAAVEKAMTVFDILAKAEAKVHGSSPDDVHFHEVGRKKNIVAIGLASELFLALNPEKFIVSPLPLADGSVQCAHGTVPAPAPALLAMLDNLPVKDAGTTGETITPSGLALLLGLGASFGPWPTIRVTKNVTAFLPQKTFEGIANGALFALGTPFIDTTPNG